MERFRASVIQTSAGADREDNLAEAAGLVARAAGDGGQLVILPERFSHYGPQDQLEFEADDGPTMRWLAQQARAYAITIGGGVLLRGADGDRGSNVFALFGPDGQVIARYRKIHLFKVELDRLRIDETESYERGDSPTVVDTPVGRIGLSICYDLRFPELYRALRAAGADLVVVPSAFTVPTGQAHWRTLLRARAIENQLYVLAADQGGDHRGVAPPSYGHSMIIDPWGDSIAALEDGIGVATAEICPDRLAQVRSRIPCWDHRVL